MKRFPVGLIVVLCLALAPSRGQAPAQTVSATDASRSESRTADTILRAAKKLVDTSGRYLHHDRLRRGMKGYGKTVLAGVEIVRFDVEIVSVMKRMGAHQDVILARLSGQNLQKTGIIQGMSGSPVYVRDPVDGKDKLIGAVAFGWWFPKEPLCGIQPITQMIAGCGNLSIRKPPAGSGPTSRPTTEPAKPPQARGGFSIQPQYLAAALNPRKIDFCEFGRSRMRRRGAGGSAQLVPLKTALMVSAASPRTIAMAARMFAPAGIVPVQSGAVGAADAEAARDARLTPGAAIGIPLVSGDADWSAVGTVTDVVGDEVLAFGHAFFWEGEVEFPMGPAYVHGVVPGMMQSFKLGSLLRVSGALTRDQATGVGGRIGQKVSTIPMTVTVDWPGGSRRQVYRYNLTRHRWLPPLLTALMICDSAWGWRELPEFHTVRHAVVIEFDKLGRYEASNVSTGADVFAAISDASRPLAVLLDNPLGARPRIKRIEVGIRIEKGDSSARILQLKLDGTTYKPGETVTGAVTVERFRRKKTSIPISFKLPGDLPEGGYRLVVCDSYESLNMDRAERPHRYDPKTVEELFRSMQRVVRPQADALYVRLPLERGGLALRRKELPDLPPSKAQIISQANRTDTCGFTESLVRSIPTEYVITGSAAVGFDVRECPQETLLHRK